MEEEYGDKAEDWPFFTAPREIGRIIRCFDEWEGCAGRATTEYSFLSEFAHPKMAAFSHYYTMEKQLSDFSQVRFHSLRVDGPPVWHVSISVVSTLHFTLCLLEIVQETEVAGAVKTLLSRHWLSEEAGA